ncbi:RNase PH-related exoribonuclease [Cenarchaeum symbiosum A]|uniref:Exosome complex component Rrp42 n=1 Tax=Cenarchaeum symbiosum (strain A) TaxID=414004 RepID=A0RXU0_CENSY|nr:RNase PH-related exoribonuclease [Cenarchaeum symbiosum A]
MVHVTVIDELKRAKIAALLERGERIDGRRLDEPRKLTIETNAIPKAEGSARVHLGRTDVVTGVKVQPDRPFPDVGDRGIFICTAEILPLAHPDVETGPPSPAVIELARVVDRGIRESGMVDLSKLVLLKDKSVIGIFADSSVIDVDGNLFDACSYAATAAILTAKLPKWEIQDEAPVRIEGETPVPVTTIPVSVTMAKINGHILVDPNQDEWAVMDARITITTNSDGNICALQKGGNSGFTHAELVKCGEISVRVGADIREIIKRAGGGS